ncbi:hypothetical protein FRB99_000466 [Tulasnella sp. 403]|nr:hypothetical protein FRB99_000466 [Tulasnella sp. 403]
MSRRPLLATTNINGSTASAPSTMRLPFTFKVKRRPVPEVIRNDVITVDEALDVLASRTSRVSFQPHPSETMIRSEAVQQAASSSTGPHSESSLAVGSAYGFSGFAPESTNASSSRVGQLQDSFLDLSRPITPGPLSSGADEEEEDYSDSSGSDSDLSHDEDSQFVLPPPDQVEYFPPRQTLPGFASFDEISNLPSPPQSPPSPPRVESIWSPSFPYGSEPFRNGLITLPSFQRTFIPDPNDDEELRSSISFPPTLMPAFTYTHFVRKQAEEAGKREAERMVQQYRMVVADTLLNRLKRTTSHKPRMIGPWKRDYVRSPLSTEVVFGEEA